MSDDAEKLIYNLKYYPCEVKHEKKLLDYISDLKAQLAEKENETKKLRKKVGYYTGIEAALEAMTNIANKKNEELAELREKIIEEIDLLV